MLKKPTLSDESLRYSGGEAIANGWTGKAKLGVHKCAVWLWAQRVDC